MKLRINEKETPNRTKYHRRKCNLLSDEEYNYWYDIGLEAFNRGDKCIPIRSKELIDYMTKNPAKIGSIESKKSNQMSIAWADGWNFGNLHNNEFKFESLKEAETPNIEVKHEGILEVPEGKNVDDLPLSHFVNLANKKGLSKITKALNNLQVWNKNDDPKLSKWAGDMIDKLNKKLKKDESVSVKDIRAITNSDRAMDYLTKIQSNERNLFNFTPYERKAALRDTRKYVKYINDEIKDTLSIMQQEEDEYNNYFLQNDSNESLTIKEHNRKLKINESMKLTNRKTYDTEFGSFTISTMKGKARRRDPLTHKSEWKEVQSTSGIFDEYPKAVEFYVERDGNDRYVTSSQGEYSKNWIDSLSASNYDDALSIVDNEVVKCFQDYYNDLNLL